MRWVQRVSRQPDKILRSGGGVGVEMVTRDERQCFIVLSNCEMEKNHGHIINRHKSTRLSHGVKNVKRPYAE